MPAQLKIDFVSDVSCPWCAIGLTALEQALARTVDTVQATLHFEPFELNPNMPPQGQDITEHLTQKYGSTPEQQTQIRENIRQRGAALGFTFRAAGRSRIYNTFDAHRLLHWAALEGADGQQHTLKKALLQAYFTDGKSPADHVVLLDCADAVGLDRNRAAQVLESVEYAAQVREREALFHRLGIHAVPAVIINDRHLIQGGQPVEVFERALRHLADHG
jgi:predicted DsbA family dithiol-disulfide isomerase